jgi:ATP-dependent Clp protease adapter protein ClpS
MRDVQAESAYLQLVFHDDDETPRDFVIDLARSVFSQAGDAAVALCAAVQRQGKAACGNYPRAVAEALLQTAQQRIEHPDIRC